MEGKNGGLECWDSFFIFRVLSTHVKEKMNHGTLASVRQVGESLDGGGDVGMESAAVVEVGSADIL